MIYYLYKQYLSEFIKKTVEKMANSLRKSKKVNHFDGKLIYTNECTGCYNLDVKGNGSLFREGDNSMAYSVFDIANWFLLKEKMTNKKLQKLCYYAQDWAYAFNDRGMFDGEFEAWVHGPVNRSLWNSLSQYGYLDIEQDKFSSQARAIDDDATLELLEDVWATYGEFSGGQLESLTHKEDPWLNARIGYEKYEPSSKKISTNDMRDYYRSKLKTGG